MTGRKALNEAIKRSVAAVKAMTPAERDALHAAQRKSWVRGELIIGLDADEERYRKASPAERKRIDTERTAMADKLLRETEQ